MQDTSVPLPNDFTAIANYSQQPRKVWTRRFSILISSLSFAIFLGWDWLTRRLQRNQQLRAKMLVQKLIKLGPTFIKLGQVLSCRPDLIPPVYVDELGNLQDKLPPFPNEQAYKVIEEELGSPYHEIYAELNPQPVAAASLGQVYKGKLHTGEIVAVKVQRPGIIEILRLDIYLLQQLAAWVQKNVPFIHTNIRALTDELASTIFKEMDYVQEAANAQTFAKLYGNLPHILVPRIHKLYTTSRVLTMEWVNGSKITSNEVSQGQGGLKPNDVIALEFKFSLQQLLKGGFFHADPHPGNILVTPEGKLAYLDFGMMSAVEPETRDLLIVFFLHLIAGDFPALAQDLISLGFLPPDTDLVPLIPKLEKMFANIRDTSIAEFGFKQIFEKLLGLVYEYSWQIPKFYVLVFRCFATIEGIALKFNPDFQAYKVGYPYIAQWVLTNKSPILWEALKNFCLSNKTIQWELVSDLLDNIYQSEDFNPYLTSERMLEFLYSPQGQPLRSVLVNEVVTNLESISKNSLQEVMSWSLAVITPLPSTMRLIKFFDFIQQFISKFSQVNYLNFLSIQELSQLYLRPELKRLIQEIVNQLGRRILVSFSQI
jgi:predicted unusual protein kinase regulating ubiquinone biosynthesis (AarF/ABC1/UbiB family)